MFGECHAHIFLNGRNYKEAVTLHKNHVSEEAIRQAFAEYRKRGITFVRDGGDALHVSEYASKIAPQYGIDYRSPMFAIHRRIPRSDKESKRSRRRFYQDHDLRDHGL